VDIAMVTSAVDDVKPDGVISREVSASCDPSQYFPERILEIYAEGDHFKICGDFSLGYV
jgi:hypothetical protein